MNKNNWESFSVLLKTQTSHNFWHLKFRSAMRLHTSTHLPLKIKEIFLNVLKYFRNKLWSEVNHNLACSNCSSPTSIGVKLQVLIIERCFEFQTSTLCVVMYFNYQLNCVLNCDMFKIVKLENIKTWVQKCFCNILHVWISMSKLDF